MIKDRATSYAFGFADPREAFNDHAVCDRDAWINGLTLPIGESFHPNRAGNIAYAEAFWPADQANRDTQTVPEANESFATPDLRLQARMVLAMNLTSDENLARAEAAGIDPATVLALDRQLASGQRREVARGLAGLHRLDTLGTVQSGKGREHAGPVTD